MKSDCFIVCLFLCVACLGGGACSKLGDDVSNSGRLSVCFAGGSEILTRAYDNLPDTSDFILRVEDSAGKTIYDGAYGDCPETLEVKPGNYVVSVKSSDFVKPAFDAPQFGDEQCVAVADGKCTYVSLNCLQLNAGVRLDISSEFKSGYSDAALLLKSSKGSLMYSFAEKRMAYFSPGPISVLMTRGAVDEVLMVKELEACNMYTVKISAPSVQNGASGCALEVAVDTARVWNTDGIVIGSSASSGSQQQDALTVSDAKNAVGQDDVWVVGYIVGGDLTSASASFEAPFKSSTNLLLGPRSSVSDKGTCIAVQLPDNEVREALNLVAHPQLLGRRVALKGDVVASYFGVCGLKNTVEYVLY